MLNLCYFCDGPQSYIVGGGTGGREPGRIEGGRGTGGGRGKGGKREKNAKRYFF